MSCCLFVNKMITREEPLFKKCCFCIPLRTCLQTWACVKVIVDISVSVYLILMIILLSGSYYGGFTFETFNEVHVFLIITVILFVDGVFMVTLSIGLCKKSLNSLRVFYCYSLYMVTISVAFFMGLLIFAIKNHVLHDIALVIVAVLLLINLCLDVCIILTVNSEIIKLRNKQQYEFFKMQNKEEPEAPENADEQLND